MYISNKITIAIGGETIDYWSNADIKSSLTSLCGSFSMQVGTKDASVLIKKIEKSANQKIEIRVETDSAAHTLLTGYIDTLDVSVGDKAFFSLAGRSATAELVDSQISEDYRGLTLANIIKKIAAAHGIDVVFEAKTSVVDKFAPHAEDAWGAIENEIKKQNLIAITDEIGRLVITNPAEGKIYPRALIAGENITDIKYTRLFKDYAAYTVYGENTSGFCKDVSVTRKRYCLIGRPDIKSNIECRQRAVFEKKKFKLNAFSLALTVPGWLSPAGDPWQINRWVNVELPQLNASGTYLIRGVAMKLSGNAYNTMLELVLPGAYE